MNISPLFCRITKVDEETRTVTGRATQEAVDRDNEVFDYASSKPNFQAWSNEIYQESAGKSYGNVRAMHGNVCAGKLSAIDFDDNEKAIDIAAKIVDDNEWKKVTSGCYLGFSIGGKYTRKWGDIVDGKSVKRYTAVPSEISIVDRPCVPAAKFYSIHKGFDFVKSDGTHELIAFRAMDGAEGREDGLGDRIAKGFAPDASLIDELLAKWNEDQPRGEGGQFGSGGTAAARADAHTMAAHTSATMGADPTNEQDKKGLAATSKASSATERALNSGARNDHKAAAAAHVAASRAWSSAGNHDVANQHARAASAHVDLMASAKKADGGVDAADGVQKVVNKSEGMELVAVAKDVNKADQPRAENGQFGSAGAATSKAEQHEKMARLHTQASQRSTPEFAAQHAKAAAAHDKAATTYRSAAEHFGAGLQASGQDHMSDGDNAGARADKLTQGLRKSDGSTADHAICKLSDAALNALFIKNQAAFTAALNGDALRKALDDTPDIKKSIYSVSSLANLIQQLKYLADGEARERKVEGDNSAVPEKLRDAAVSLLTILSDMAREEGTEIATGTTAEDVMADATPGSNALYRMVHTDVSKFSEDALHAHADALRLAIGIPEDLAKRGARNSTKDLALLQSVHDNVCELGAECKQPGPHAMDGKPVTPVVKAAETQNSQGVGDMPQANDVNKDAISSEGNSRGANVTSPSLPQQSSNATPGGPTADNTGATKAKPKPSWMEDADGDDDSTKAQKAKAREMFAPPAAKADGVVQLTAEQLGDIITKSVQAAMGAQPAAAVNKGVDVTPIPRVAPNLMVVGQNGTVQKFEGAEGVGLLQKSVKPHPHDTAGEDGGGLYKSYGDNKTTSLIKAIHANNIQIPDSDCMALGLRR